MINAGGVNLADGSLSPLDERSAAQLADGLLQLGLGVHHDRAVPGDRLLERLA
jgi:hypothetical protein